MILKWEQCWSLLNLISLPQGFLLSHFVSYLEKHGESLHMMPSIKAILADAKEALSQLPPWERGFHLFWL